MLLESEVREDTAGSEAGETGNIDLWVVATSFVIKKIWVQIPTLPISGLVTLDKEVKGSMA